MNKKFRTSFCNVFLRAAERPPNGVVMRTALFFLLLTPVIFAQRVLTLEDALGIALEESYSIKTAQLQLESSQKTLEAIKLGLMTGISMEFDLPDYNRSLISQFNPVTGSEQFYKVENTTVEGRLFLTQPIALTNGTFSLVGSLFGRSQFTETAGNTRDYFSNLSFRLSQPLFTFNTLSASIDRAEINLQKSKRNYTAAEQEIRFRVTEAYYRLVEAKKRAEIAGEKVAQTQVSFETASNKYRAGLIAEVEALQLEVDLAASKNDLLSAQTNFEESRNDFKLLLGLPLDDQIDVTGDVPYTPVTVDSYDAIAAALMNRPELENRADDITLREMAINEVDSKGNISALITANYGINKNDELFKNIFHDFAENRTLTLTVSVPVWDWGQNDREVEAAVAELKMTELDYRNQKEQITKEILSLINRLQAAKARVDVLSKSVELAQKSYDISMERFNAGTITSFDLSQMQLRLTDAKLNSLSALIDYRITTADLTRKTYVDYLR